MLTLRFANRMAGYPGWFWTVSLAQVEGSAPTVLEVELIRAPEGVEDPGLDATLFIPLALSRQELADMTGTTIETGIRIMSRWGKEDVVHTEKDGFVILDREILEALAAE